MKKLLSLLLVIATLLMVSCQGVEDAAPAQSETPPQGPEDPAQGYTYTDFTPSEKALFEQYIGTVIPFMPNNEYYVEGYYEEADYEHGMNFYTYGNTAEDFANYRALYVGYTLSGTKADEEGDTWYTYEKDDVVVDMAFYSHGGKNVTDVYVYSSLSTDPEPDEPEPGYAYTDFTEDEKALFTRYIGTVIPFVPNDEYYVEGYYEETDYENGMCFYTFGNTEAEFAAYRALFVGYTFIGTDTDDYGDTWYTYEKDDVVVDMAHYYYEGAYVIDVYVYSSLSIDLEDGGEDGGEDSGNTDSGDVEQITNEGKGLPEGVDGVFDVDFKKADKVKDVTDQGYYLDGCPTTGSPAVLVIPVEFQDATAASRGYTTDKLVTAFMGASGSTDYYSVLEYYRASSYGQLTLDVTVLDF